MFNSKNLTGEISIGKWIEIISKHQKYYLNKNLEKYNINNGEYKILIHIYLEEGICQKDLVNILKLDKFEIAKGIKKLVKEDFISKCFDQKDRRITKLYLTDKSKKIKEEFIELLKNSSNILTKDLTKDEIILINNYLSKMAENIYKESNKLKNI